MSVFDEMRALIDKMEKEDGPMFEIVDAMKTDGGHLTNFGDEFVMLCRKWDIQQATVARAIDISATSVNRRYNRQIVKGSFWHRKK